MEAKEDYTVRAGELRLAQVLRGRPKDLPQSSALSDVPNNELSPAPVAGEWEWFSRMAGLLLGASTLVIGTAHFDVVEIEAYLWCEGHADPYVHRDPQQMNTCGEWYFHREKAAKIGFTLKGLDLTFGEPGKEAGGLLLRAILDQATDEFIEGPSKVVDRILRGASVTSVTELKRKTTGPQAFRSDAFDADGFLRIESKAATKRSQVLRIRAGPRVGLGEKNAHYRQAPYRFHARPEWAKKGKAKIAAGVLVSSQLEPRTRTEPLSDEEQLGAKLRGAEDPPTPQPPIVGGLGPRATHRSIS
jgi:hypothetical protein